MSSKQIITSIPMQHSYLASTSLSICKDSAIETFEYISNNWPCYSIINLVLSRRCVKCVIIGEVSLFARYKS